jgi:hypothetical protein
MSHNHGPKIAKDNLIFYLDPANNKSYPGSGTSVYDLSGRKNNSTLLSGVTYSSNNRGILSFDGTSTSYVNIGASTRYFPMPSFTLETWVKSAGLGTGMTLGGIFGISYGLTVYFNAGGTLSFFNYNTDSGYPGTYDVGHTVSDMNLFDDIWHHIVCTRNSSIYTIYIDGVQKASAAVSVPSWSGTNVWSDMDAHLGNNPNDSPYKLKGSMSMPKIYNKALSREEIIRNYSVTKKRFGL